jgi:hypothetical protein
MYNGRVGLTVTGPKESVFTVILLRADTGPRSAYPISGTE